MLSDWIEIDGRKFNVTVTEISESATITYSDNSGRTIAKGAPMTLDPLGTFFNYKVTVKRQKDNFDDYDALYEFITEPRYNGFDIKIVHNQSTWTFSAYVSAAERSLSRIDEKNNKVYWKEMSLNIVAMKAQVLPL